MFIVPVVGNAHGNARLTRMLQPSACRAWDDRHVSSRSLRQLEGRARMTEPTETTAIEAVMVDHPELSDFGFGAFGPLNKSPEERDAFIAASRARMREPRSLVPFALARDWLAQFRKIKGINRHGTSYGLKHVAEHAIGYVTNGVFIAAAIAEGFTIQRDGPNAYLNISMGAWRR
jgi:hypothetical protein